MPKAKSVAKQAGDTISSYIKLFTNLVNIGVTAATSSTFAIVADAANAASDRAVQPFNSLVKSATQQFFAPQIAYPISRWEGLVGSTSNRRRSMTGASSGVCDGSDFHVRRGRVTQRDSAGQSFLNKSLHSFLQLT